jgi:alpha-mannosidase
MRVFPRQSPRLRALVKLKIPAPEGIALGDGPFVVENKPTQGEVSFQKWLGVQGKDGEIFAVINDGVYSGMVKDGFIYLTLLRGAGYCMHPMPIDSEGTIPGERKLYPTDRYLPRIDGGRYTYKLRIMKGNLDEITRMSELFNQKPYAINVFPIGTGEKSVSVETNVPVAMTTFKPSENSGWVGRFFNPANEEKTFTLTINGDSVEITMKKAEVVSVIYENGRFTVCEDTLPI